VLAQVAVSCDCMCGSRLPDEFATVVTGEGCVFELRARDPRSSSKFCDQKIPGGALNSVYLSVCMSVCLSHPGDFDSLKLSS
jgi:hypothetical protein